MTHDAEGGRARRERRRARRLEGDRRDVEGRAALPEGAKLARVRRPARPARLEPAAAPREAMVQPPCLTTAGKKAGEWRDRSEAQVLAAVQLESLTSMAWPPVFGMWMNSSGLLTSGPCGGCGAGCSEEAAAPNKACAIAKGGFAGLVLFFREDDVKYAIFLGPLPGPFSPAA